MRNMFPRVKGAARAMAQGQAKMSTEVNTWTGVAGEWKSQYRLDPRAMVSTARVKRLPMASGRVWKLLALSLEKTEIPQSWVRWLWDTDFRATTSITPPNCFPPANNLSPLCFWTASDSPVTKL